MTDTPTTGPEAASRRSPGRRVFWLAFALFFVLGSVWALTNPIGASPDEPAHVMKAAVVGAGDFSSHADGWFEVTRTYAQANDIPGCFARIPGNSGACSPAFVDGRDEVVRVQSSAGTYDPIYYALVGWVERLPIGGAPALYLMRLVSVALSAALLASAFRSVAESRRPAWMVIGLSVAIFPQTVFLASTVNPSSVEVTAALVLWTTLPVALGAPPGALTRRQFLRAGIAAILLGNAKGYSLLYLAIVVAVCLMFVGWRATWRVVRDRRSWWGLGLGIAGGVFAAWWTVYANSLGFDRVVIDPTWTWAYSTKYLWFEAGPSIMRNMIGQFGWMDTDLHPHIAYAFWAAIALATIIGLIAGRWRQRLGIAALAVACFATPIYIQTTLAPYTGPVWQGRYLIALIVGLPILSGLATADRVSWTWISRKWLAVLAALTGGAVASLIFVAWMTNTARYMTGAFASWSAFGTGSWFPPLPISISVILLVGVILGWALLCWYIAQLPTTEPTPQQGSRLNKPIDDSADSEPQPVEVEPAPSHLTQTEPTRVEPVP